MIPIIEVPPAVEPVTGADLVAHLNAISDDEALLATKAAVARAHVERFLGRALITQTVSVTFDRFREATIRLPWPPFQSIVWVKYYDEGDVQQVFGDYTASIAGDVGHVWADAGWPATYDRPDAVKITFIAGYGDAAGDVPEDLKEAIRSLAGHLYENREATFVGSGGVQVLPFGVEALLQPYRERVFA